MSKLIIRNGRVMDPASNLDAVRDVATEDGRIAAIGHGLEAAGAVEIDTVGLVVADDVTHDRSGGTGGGELDPGLLIAVEIVIGDEIVVGNGEHADGVIAEVVIGDGGMRRREIDPVTFVAVDKVVEDQRLSDVFNRDAVAGRAGDIAAREGACRT